jgi:hypothetical protein
MRIDGNDITADSYNLAKLSKTFGVDESQMSKMLNLMKQGKTVDQAEKSIENEKKREQKRIKDIGSYASSLGITELRTPGELVLAKILESIDKKLVPAAEKIAGIMEGIFSFLLEPNKFIQEKVKEGSGYDKFRDTLNDWTGGLVDYYAGRGYEFHGRGFTKMSKNAMGGIVSKPSIAGEAGPEAILPLQGSGKESFTKPFLEKVTFDNNKEILQQLKELNNNFKVLTNKKYVIDNKLFIDARQIARSLTEAALIIS